MIPNTKKSIARLLVLTLALSMTGIPASANDKVSIPAVADLTVLSDQPMSLDTANTYLVNWRTGPITSQVGNMTFQYFGPSDNTTAYPNEATVKDNTANNQGDLWSDNAIQVTYTKGNLAGSAILIYTNNEDQFQVTRNPTDQDDPLYGVALRGGVIGGFGGSTTNPYRISVLPLIWKAVSSADLTAVQGVNALTGSPAIPSSPNTPGNPLWMSTEITSTTGGFCPPNGPYDQPSGVARTNNGFCDFSTHYLIDENNNVHLPGGPGLYSNSWYSSYPNTAAICYGTTSCSTAYTGAFNYASLIGPFGINSTENGAGGLGGVSPAYILLGVQSSAALLTHYGTTIYVEVRSQ